MVLVNLLSSTTLDELDNTPRMELFVGSLVSIVYHAMHDLLNTIHTHNNMCHLKQFIFCLRLNPRSRSGNCNQEQGRGQHSGLLLHGVRESLPVVLTARDNQTCP